MASTELHARGESAELFASTQWSAVFLAGSELTSAGRVALEKLCASYWPPLYAYVRRQGYPVTDAQDLTQEFFFRLLDQRILRLADPQRGRFRTFLLTSLKNFLITEWQKSRAQKRGGHHAFLSWDGCENESGALREVVLGESPERAYERRWAMMVLERTQARLCEEYGSDGRQALFAALKPYLWGETPAGGYAALAQQLGMSEGAVRVAMHRIREAFRRLLRLEVGRTVSSASEIDAELRDLIAALRD